MPITLMAHQDAGAAMIAERPRFGIWDDPGTGKTITLLSGLVRSGLLPRTVVVCPLSVARTAWVNDAKHFPQIKIGIAAGEPLAVRRRVIESQPDVVVINREIFAKSADLLWQHEYTRLVYDEASALKYHDSGISKAVREYARKATHFYPLSGTPAPGGDWQFYTVLACLRPDRFQSETPFKFWYRYFTPQTERVRVKAGQVKSVVRGWTPKDGAMREEFLRLVASCGRTVRKRDVLDLPPFTDSIRLVRLSDAEAEAYRLLKDEARAVVKEHADHPGETVRVKAESVLNKCRQLCGGWMYVNDAVTRYGTAKLDALDELLDELGAEPSIVCVDFREDSRAVGELLKARGAAYRSLVGGGDDAGEAVAAFQDGRVQNMILHPQSAGHGVTLTRASVMTFFTCCWSPELFAQVRARIDRRGQQRAMTYYHLHAEGTVDPGVLKVVSDQTASGDRTMAVLSEFSGDNFS